MPGPRERGPNRESASDAGDGGPATLSRTGSGSAGLRAEPSPAAELRTPIELEQVRPEPVDAEQEDRHQRTVARTTVVAR